jgi:hypothetical protein
LPELIEIGLKYSGTITFVLGETAFTSAMKDCNRSMDARLKSGIAAVLVGSGFQPAAGLLPGVPP